LVVFSLLCTFITKSAQIPFSSWLPAAIAAPTPVSSLVHSSTLVTAGVFLIIRFNTVISSMFWLLLTLSLCTILIAGVVANFEWDIKKIIAFSTLRQLGFIVFSISLGLFFFCFFHLLCHALFKASLFMSSGVIIHRSDRSQEFRSGFKFSKISPIVRRRVLISVFCLCGFPFLSGFFSKDYILDSFSSNLVFFSLFFNFCIFNCLLFFTVLLLFNARHGFV